MRTALFPGSFSPPTLGHQDLIKRASKLFDRLYIGIALNTQKAEGPFSVEEKSEMLKIICSDLSNVEIIVFNGLTVDVIEERKLLVLIRGLRSNVDLTLEMQMAAANKQMTGVDTVFLPADVRYAHLSSTLIREIGAAGRHLHGFVPDAIEEIVFRKLR